MKSPGMAYVLGPISRHGPRFLPVYRAAVGACERHFAEVIGSWPTFWDHAIPPSDYDARIRALIPSAALFIAEVSEPSHGVGLELQMGADAGIPLLLMHERGAAISNMVLGLPTVRGRVEYADAADLAARLDERLREFAPRAR